MKSLDLDATARFFSHGILRDLSTKGRSPLLGRLASQSGLLALIPSGERLSALFQRAFIELRKYRYRDEYTYQDAITRQILLKRHSLATASLIPEFRVGSCKADVVIFNGTSTAYEIKSERDNLDRLEAQLDSYLRAFARVCVVAGPNHLQTLTRAVPASVGIMVLTDSNRLDFIREPRDNSDNVCAATIFDGLRISEAIEVLRRLNIPAPDAANTEIYNLLRPIFSKLPGKQVHDCAVSVLRMSRSAAKTSASIGRLPTSLRTAALLTRITKSGQDKLCEILSGSAHEVLSWG